MDKYKIKANKFGFFMLCVLFFGGLIFALRITDVFVETTEIQAIVTHTYENSHNTLTYSPGGQKMNIEWVDLNGEIQTEGNIANDTGLEEGDSYYIRVDAKTQSRRTLSKVAAILMFAIGLIMCIGSLKLMNLFYRKTW